jgi:hypothetical protein
MRVPTPISLLAFLLAFLPLASNGEELPPTSIAYEIEVTLDPSTRMLEGRQTIRWTHPGDQALRTVPLHLYLNAFSHERTTWMGGVPARRLRPDEFIDRWPDPWGWNEPVSIRQGDVDLDWRPIAPDDGNHLDRSLIEVTLAQPLQPGETLSLEVEFSARLPIVIARTGAAGDFFLVAQWFPKIGAFETEGTRGAEADRWAAHQFHGATEFYADYADYDVRIGVPEGWPVVATGRGGPQSGEGSGEDPSDLVWHRFRQRAVHDFAFSTGRRMVSLTAPYQPKGTGGPVDVTVFLPLGTEHQEPRWRRAAEACLDVMGSRIGPYPYDVLTVVQAPAAALRTLGMEYPTLFTGGFGDPLWDLDLFGGLNMSESVIAHECAHQYFYGLVGTNEFEEAFLDEGFTDHWGNEIMIAAYGEDGYGELLGRPISITEIERVGLPGRAAISPPILSGPSYLLRGHSMGAQFYNRPAATMRTAAALFGSSVVDRVFAEYFRVWKFRHPGFEDLLAAARAAGGEQVAGFIEEAYTQTTQPDYRIADLRTDGWAPPRGRLVGLDGSVDEVSDPSTAPAGLGLHPAAREEDGRLMVQVLDPGWTRGRVLHPGRIVRRAETVETGQPDENWESDENEFYFSMVRLEGPSWASLPVEVMFRFADGAVIRETWDGRAPYRIYRFLRPAPLSEARLDPDGKIALDPDPVNNARLRQPNRRLVNDWAYWVGALAQLIGEALASWL